MGTELSLDSRLTVPPQVMARPVGDEYVILDLESGVYFGVEGVGKRIWEAAEAGKRVRDAVDGIVAEYDVDVAEAETDVIAFASDLVGRGLLEAR